MTRKRSKARTFGQDLMRGEHVVGEGKAKRTPNAIPGGGTGPNSAYRQRGRKADTKAIGTTDWVNQKKAEGDIDGGLAGEHSGTSIFDPVLCELAYRWFCPPAGLVLDPFAGGSVRGIVASKLGRRYVGVDLRPEQIEANRDQAAKICGPDDPAPVWHAGDSADVVPGLAVEADFIFSCPPYGDLEVYSDLAEDLSTMPHKDFLIAYRKIIAAAVAKLRPDRFACFVVGDFRDAKGNYRNFVSDTIGAFLAAGTELYNEAILVTAAGSLPIRVGRQFETARKLGKTHQQVLVFVKGDGKKATQAIGPVECGDPLAPEAGTAPLAGVEEL
jgi:hypothetical protein